MTGKDKEKTLREDLAFIRGHFCLCPPDKTCKTCRALGRIEAALSRPEPPASDGLVEIARKIRNSWSRDYEQQLFPVRPWMIQELAVALANAPKGEWRKARIATDDDGTVTMHAMAPPIKMSGHWHSDDARGIDYLCKPPGGQCIAVRIFVAEGEVGK